MNLPFSTNRKPKFGGITCALVVGAGAVQNAWLPVIRAIQPYYETPLSGQGTNCVFARIVYTLRWWCSLGDDELANKELPKLKEFLEEIKEAICLELKAAQETGEIRVREQFNEIVERFVVPNCTRFMLVSTNWDTVVDEAILRVPSITIVGRNSPIYPMHIHGSVANPKTLYLPTELTREPYRAVEERNTIGGLHTSLMAGLEQAERVVLYGLSISPLDGELSQDLGAGWDNPVLKRIIIVDPDHETIAERVNLLLRNPKKIRVVGYDPRNLKVPIEYSVKRT